MAAVRMAFDLRKLTIAAAGILALQLGWWLLNLAFSDSSAVTPDVLPPTTASRTGDDLKWTTEGLIERLSAPARNLIVPLFALLDPKNRWLAMLHALLAVGWLIVVWGYCGGAIARIAAIQEAQTRQPRIAEAVRFALRSGPPLIVTPVYPLLGLAFCSLTGLLFGLLYRIPGGPVIGGFLVFIPLLAGVVMAILVAALVAGWPMFHAALAAGADDALDALSRTYSYLNQRLAHFAAGVAIAALAGFAGLTLVDWFAGGILRLTRWSLSLSGPPSDIALLFGPEAAGSGTLASATHHFWLGAVRLLARAWSYSYFWSAAVVLYLWLRHEVDGTPTVVIDPPGPASGLEPHTPDALPEKDSAP
jgi:hypothetical protein